MRVALVAIAAGVALLATASAPISPPSHSVVVDVRHPCPQIAPGVCATHEQIADEPGEDDA